MLRRELLKGLLALPFLPLARFAKGGTVTRDSDMEPFEQYNYTIQAAWADAHCMVWNRELSTLEVVPLRENGGRHFFGCVCVYPVAGHDLSPVEVTTEYRGGWLRTVDVRRA